VEAPLDEVLAVVAEKAITLLAEARAGALDRHFHGVTGVAMLDHEHRAAAGELLERHLFHGLADDVVHQRAVVHHLAIAGVEPVMGEAEPGCDEVRAAGG